MTRFTLPDDYEDGEAAELRAEARAERRRAASRNHFCEVCLGRTGPGSPCAPDDEEPQAEAEQDEEQE